MGVPEALRPSVTAVSCFDSCMCIAWSLSYRLEVYIPGRVVPIRVVPMRGWVTWFLRSSCLHSGSLQASGVQFDMNALAFDSQGGTCLSLRESCQRRRTQQQSTSEPSASINLGSPALNHQVLCNAASKHCSNAHLYTPHLRASGTDAQECYRNCYCMHKNF